MSPSAIGKAALWGDFRSIGTAFALTPLNNRGFVMILTHKRQPTSGLGRLIRRSTPAVTLADRVEAHTALVRRIAWHVHGHVSAAAEIEDLLQTGMVALIEAAGVYEDRGHDFATYATLRVRGAMIDLLRRNAPQSRGLSARRRELNAKRDQLEQKLHRAPTDIEMAAALGLLPADYHATVSAAESVWHESLDQVYSDYEPWFADTAPDATDIISTKQRRAILTSSIEKLPPREALVLQLYFVEELNLDEIGLMLDIGAARVCQIKKAALDRIRSMLAAKGDL
jgi:RNA polymerase sigma factor FliA